MNAKLWSRCTAFQPGSSLTWWSGHGDTRRSRMWRRLLRAAQCGHWRMWSALCAAEADRCVAEAVEKTKRNDEALGSLAEAETLMEQRREEEEEQELLAYVHAVLRELCRLLPTEGEAKEALREAKEAWGCAGRRGKDGEAEREARWACMLLTAAVATAGEVPRSELQRVGEGAEPKGGDDGVWNAALIRQLLHRVGAAGHGADGKALTLLDFAAEGVAIGEEMNDADNVHVFEWVEREIETFRGWKDHATEQAMDRAAALGGLEIVEYLHHHRQEGCTPLAMNCASLQGHLDVVEFLHKHRSEGCSSLAMDLAALHGHLPVLEFLHRQRPEGCTSNALTSAAENGHLRTVEWLSANREEGCHPRTVFSCIEAYVSASGAVAAPAAEDGEVVTVQDDGHDEEEQQEWRTTMLAIVNALIKHGRALVTPEACVEAALSGNAELFTLVAEKAEDRVWKVASVMMGHSQPLLSRKEVARMLENNIPIDRSSITSRESLLATATRRAESSAQFTRWSGILALVVAAVTYIVAARYASKGLFSFW